MIQRILDWGKFNSPAIFALAMLLIGAAKWFFVNHTLTGYSVPSEAVDVAIGGIGALLSVHGVGSLKDKVAQAKSAAMLPNWLEVPLAKFLTDFKMKSPRAWLMISMLALGVYIAVKYSLTASWTLPKVVVDAVLTVAPFILSSQTTGILAIQKEK